MRISERKKDIHVHNMDAMKLVAQISEKQGMQNTLYYFDPPYYAKGAYLYMNHYRKTNHEDIAKCIQKIKQSKWIVSYDDVQEIRNYYSERRNHTCSIYHTAKSAHLGNEVLFFSDNLTHWDKVVMEIPNSRKCASTQ